MIGLVVPTLNRSSFVIRQLHYYAEQGEGICLYIGDSSGREHADKTLQAIRDLDGQVAIEYFSFPELNDVQATAELLHRVKEPYTALLPDDDLIVPPSLRRCADYLEAHEGYSSAHGVAIAGAINTGRITYLGGYTQKAVEQESGRQRIQAYLNDYYAAHFAVHRTEQFRRFFDAAVPIPERGFWELLPCCMSIIGGKAKQLDCLYLFRQHHDQRYLLRDLFDVINSDKWAPSYKLLHDELVRELVRVDGICEAEAADLIKKAVYSYVANGLLVHWQSKWGKSLRMGSKGGLSESLTATAKNVIKGIPGLGQFAKKIKMRKELFTEEALLRPSSKYYEDFIPLHKHLTSDFSL
jgi:glycosyltransferase domain-containing protein